MSPCVVDIYLPAVYNSYYLVIKGARNENGREATKEKL